MNWRMPCISYVAGLILGMIVMAVVYKVSGRIGRHHCTVDTDAAPVAIVDMGSFANVTDVWASVHRCEGCGKAFVLLPSVTTWGEQQFFWGGKWNRIGGGE